MQANLRTLVFCLAALFCVTAGTYKASHFSKDLIPVYSGVRCLLHGCNPYDTAQLEEQYLAGDGDAKLLGGDFWRSYIPVYPPSTFLVLSPMGLLRFPVLRPVWAILSSGLFIIAAGAVLFACPRRYRWVATILVSLFLVVKVNTSLLAQGNPTPFAIALLILGTVLLLRDRNIPLATLLLMISLAVKPQLGGLIALYFVAKRIHWRAVVVAMAGALMILVIAGVILRVNPRSHDWVPSLQANVAESIQPGQTNDPRPESLGAMGIVNLQTITSVFFDDSKTFNAAAFGIFAAMLAVWIAAVLKANNGPNDHYLPISALVLLSLLPVYHRSGDDLLLLLTIPAVILILEKRPALGAWVAVMTAMVCVAEFTDSLRVHIVQHYFGWPGILQHKVLVILLLRQQSLLLLVLFGLYLTALLFRVPARVEQQYLRPAVSEN